MFLVYLPIIMENPIDEITEDNKKLESEIPVSIPDNTETIEEPVVRGNEPVTFTNVSEAVGLAGKTGNYFSWTDYNNDGYQDLLVNGWKLYENDGPPDYNFTYVSPAANLTGGVSNGVWGDYDNDGYLDMFAGAGLNGNDKLYHNNGNGTFTDVTQSAGGITDTDPTSAAGWGDFDRDGDLDLYVANGENSNNGNPIYYADKFYRNNGDGTFTDITVAAGIDDYTSPYYGRGVAWGDYDNDGWQDIYISNYRLQPNYLWRNNHQNNFTDVAFLENVTGLGRYYQTDGPYYGHTIGSAWGDLNNDGNLDLWVSNLVHKYVGGTDIRGYICDDSNIFMNKGGPFYNFSDGRPKSGIPKKPVGGSGTYIGDELWFNVALGDFDNDGDLDAFVPQGYDLNYAYSYLFRNNNDGTFTDISTNAGLRTWNTYGGAWADYNNDGFLDLVTGGKSPFVGVGQGKSEIHLFKNNGNLNNWLSVILLGNESNYYGIGTRVTVTTDSGTQIREVEGGSGCHSHQNSLPVEFGIGNNPSVNKVEVRWPNGRIQIFTNVPANVELPVVENMNAPSITSISVDKISVYEDDVLTFNAAASDPDGTVASYSWDFNGDGVSDWTSTSSAGPVNYNYTRTGVYNARLTVMDNTGVLGAYASTEYITVKNVIPTPDAGNDVTAWEDERITFSANASSDSVSDVDYLMFKWDFDDGTISDPEWSYIRYIDHTYTVDGIYNVKLYVRDDDNVISIDNVTVTVNNLVPVCDAGSDLVVAEDEVIDFSGTGFDTTSDIPLLEYRWDFGDGTATVFSSTSAAKHSYYESGVYTVTLTISDSDITGNDTLNVTVYNPVPNSYVMSNTSVKEDETVWLEGWGTDNPSDKSEIEYYWDFGDGTNSGWLLQPNLTHTYTEQGTYQARLIVRDGDGATGNATVVITVTNVAPGVEAGRNMKGDEDDLIMFKGSGTDTESDQSSLLYSWDFSDGSEPSAWNRSPYQNHTFTAQGKYKVYLKVMDNNGEEAQDYLDVVISNVPPTAMISSDKINIDENEVVKLYAGKSSDTPSDLPALNYTWKFRNGVFLYGLSVEYIYTDPGSYEVTLSVEDDDNEIDEDTITIKVKNLPPEAEFSIITNRTEVGDIITFSAVGTTDTENDMETLIYEWSFGDGNISIGEVVTHEYARADKYTVKLTVTDNNGDVDTVIRVIDIETNTSASGESGTSPIQNEKGSLPKMILIAAVISFIIVIIFIFLFLRISKRKNPASAVLPVEAEPVQGIVVDMPVTAAGDLPPGFFELNEEAIITAQPVQMDAAAGVPAEMLVKIDEPGAQAKPPFCGQCGSQGQLTPSGLWYCPGCNLVIKDKENVINQKNNVDELQPGTHALEGSGEQNQAAENR